MLSDCGQANLSTTEQTINKLGKDKARGRNSIVGFLGGLPVQTTFKELEAYVRSFGPIYYLSFPVDSVTGKHKGFAKVFFKKQGSLDYALSFPVHSMHGVEFGFSAWVSKKNFSSKKEKPAANKLFFKMSAPIAEDDLLQYFTSFGPVSKLDIKQDYEIGQQRNIGFVIYMKDTDAASVIHLGSVHFIQKKRITVQPSRTTKQVIKASKQAKKCEYGVEGSKIHRKPQLKTSETYSTVEQFQCYQGIYKNELGERYPLKNEYYHQNSKDWESNGLSGDPIKAQSSFRDSLIQKEFENSQLTISFIMREYAHKIHMNHKLSNLRIRWTTSAYPQVVFFSL